mmetsp:Transcript_3409/g.4005  ORF Transcript_3409/g.4005 Transcript_3409/m.4005 type:complete len:178 (-) Transcript_3409:11-544(-)
MALAISAVLPSGKRLDALTADLSWSGAQIKAALSHQFGPPGYVSALVYKDQTIDDDQVLKDFCLCSEGNPEMSNIEFNVVVSELIKLSDVAQLPGMTAEYKFANWSAEEIYPEEEDAYRETAAKTECYFLKPKLGAEKPLFKVILPQEWVDFYNEIVEQNGQKEPDRKFYRRASHKH